MTSLNKLTKKLLEDVINENSEEVSFFRLKMKEKTKNIILPYLSQIMYDEEIDVPSREFLEEKKEYSLLNLIHFTWGSYETFLKENGLLENKTEKVFVDNKILKDETPYHMLKKL